MTGKIVHYRPIEDRSSELKELYERTFPEEERPVSQRLASPHSEYKVGFPGSDASLIEKAKEANRLIRKLYVYGDTSGFESPSHADYCLAAGLVFWTGPDPDRLEDLMWSSALVRDKWKKHPTYLHKTCSKAIDNCKYYYDPKYGEKTRATVERVIDGFMAWGYEHSWTGRGGPTDRDIYFTLLAAARRNGRLASDGVEVAIAVRTLASEARVGNLNTVCKSLDRLAQRGLVSKVSSGDRKKANVYCLHYPKIGYQRKSETLEGPQFYRVTPLRGLTGRLRSHSSRLKNALGKRNGQIIDFVYASESTNVGGVTIEDIAAHLGVKRVRDLVNRNLRKLVELGFLIEDAGVYTTHEDIEWRLDSYLYESGHDLADRIQRTDYEMQRAIQIHNRKPSEDSRKVVEDLRQELASLKARRDELGDYSPPVYLPD